MSAHLASISRYSINAATFVASLSLFFHHVANFADVQGDSMYPTLNGGSNYLMVQKYQALNMLEVGDVVVLRSPVDPESLLVKRVIGLSGQVIPVPIDPTTIPTNMLPHLPTSKPLQIPIGHMWLEGDNLDQSIDSRHFGAIPQALIVGIARCKFDLQNWSLTKLTIPKLWNPQTRRIIPVNIDLYRQFQHYDTFMNQNNNHNNTNNQQQHERQQVSFVQNLLKSRHQQPQTIQSSLNTTSSNSQQIFTNNIQSQLNQIEPSQELQQQLQQQQQQQQPTRLQIPRSEWATQKVLQQIYSKRENNQYYSNPILNQKFQSYLSSYERVYNPQLSSIYDTVLQQQNQQTLSMGTRTTTSTTPTISPSLTPSSTNNQLSTSALLHQEQQQLQQPYQQQQLNNQPQFTQQTTTSLSTPPTLQRGIISHRTDENGFIRMSRQEQLDMLLPQITPAQRESLLNDYDDTDTLPLHDDNNYNINNVNSNESLFSFNWINNTNNDNNSIHKERSLNATNTPNQIYNSQQQDQKQQQQQLQQQQQQQMNPQIGEVRSKINPYLDIIPQEHDTIVIPTVYYESIQLSTQQQTQPTTHSDQIQTIH